MSEESVVAAAQGGDRRAQAELFERYLPLVYSVVGRAADVDLDVDDIVQETMMRAVSGLSGLRDAGRFRSWLVTIALRELTDARGAARRQRLARVPEPDVLVERADPGAEFAGLVMLRQALSHEQREVAEASRWLDDGFRELLSLWWLEVGGRLDRADVAAALGESVGHVGVRVQRMKEQLDTCRAVVRAVRATEPCAGLAEVLAEWDGKPDPLWRKRIARHLRDCPVCSGRSARLVPPERLLAGVPLLVPPSSVHLTAAHPLRSVAGAGRLKAALVAAGAGAAVVAIVLGVVVTRPSKQPAAIGAVEPPRPAATAIVGASTAPSPAPSAPFITTVPKVASPEAAGVRAVTQNSRIAGRDNGQSTLYGDKSVWVFDDTTLKNPFGFLSSTGAATRDLDASDGITLTSGNPVTVDAGQAPVDLIPHTASETAFEKRCTDQFCKAVFGYWPGPVVADPARGRVLVFYGKLCRGAADGTPCSGPLGKGLGTGVAAIDMSTGKVTRLTTDAGLSSVEGKDPTMLFPDGAGYGAAAVVVDGELYAYGACTYQGCHVGRVPLADVAVRSRWTFWTPSHTWSPDAGKGTNVVAAGAAGQTVFYDPALRAWLNVYLPYGANAIMYQVGGSPFGPWSAARTAMKTPGGRTADYALFAHPEFSPDNGLTQYLTYFHPDTGEQRLVRLRF